jgi:hypothetical protein
MHLPVLSAVGLKLKVQLQRHKSYRETASLVLLHLLRLNCASQILLSLDDGHGFLS